MKIKFITTASNPDHPGLKKLEKSLNHFGWDSLFLINAWRGYGSKFRDTYDYLKTGEEDNTDLIVYSDSYDSFMLATPEEVIEKYMANFSPKLLYYSERACWPHENLAAQYPKVEGTPYQYLNGGGVICSPSQYIKLIELDFPEYDINDQVHSTNLYLNRNREANIVLDHFAKIYQCIGHHGETDFSYEDGRLINNITGEKPCIIHGNGHTPMDKIYALLK